MSLREILLIAVIGVLCVVALFRPRIGLYGYVWYATMRPDVMAWCADQYPFSLALAVCTLLGSIPYLVSSVSRVWHSPITRCLIILQIPLALSVVFAVVPSLADSLYLEYLKMIAVLLLIPLLIRSEADLRRLLLVVCFSLGMVGASFGLFGLIHGGVILTSGYGGMMSDNNLVALPLAMLAPLCWYVRDSVRSSIVRLALLVILLLSIATIVMTNSRGGTLALIIAVLLILLRSQRKLAAVLIFALGSGVAIYLVRDEYLTRMATLQHYENEESAASRIEHAKVAMRIWEDYPLFGVGFGGKNYAALASTYMEEENIHVAHNSYLQMLVDSGVLAFTIYIGLLIGTFIWLGRSARTAQRMHLKGHDIPLAIQASLVAFLVGGTFYSSQRYDLPYILLLCAAAWHKISGVAMELSEEEAEGAVSSNRTPHYLSVMNEVQ